MYSLWKMKDFGIRWNPNGQGQGCCYWVVEGVEEMGRVRAFLGISIKCRIALIGDAQFRQNHRNLLITDYTCIFLLLECD